MHDPLARRELELARTRIDERIRVAEGDRLLRERRAAEPKATDALLDTVAAALIGAGERLKARSIHLTHAHPVRPRHSCSEQSYP